MVGIGRAAFLAEKSLMWEDILSLQREVDDLEDRGNQDFKLDRAIQNFEAALTSSRKTIAETDAIIVALRERHSTTYFRNLRESDHSRPGGTPEHLP